MIDVGDDGDVSKIVSFLHPPTLLAGLSGEEIHDSLVSDSCHAGRVTFYADLPARRTRQMLGDAWLVAWTLIWIWVAIRLHDLVMNLAAPGLAIAESADDLAIDIESAGQAVGGIPLLGSSLSAPFDGMAGAARQIADAGQAQADAVGTIATTLSVSIAVIAIASFAVVWVPIRIAFIRRATAARAFLDSNADLDLFALRAMARQPLHVLAKIDPDPAGAWRRGDARVTRALAELELRSEGLRPPTVTHS